MLTAERARELFRYNPENGELRWIASKRGRRAGAIAGYANREGYWVIEVEGERFVRSRLVWLHVIGDWPLNEIDHIDKNPSNDRWDNLREATSSENKCNRPKQANNTSGFKGVSWDREKQRWLAQIVFQHRHYHIGRFDTPEEAHKAYVTAAEELHKEFRRT